MESDFLEIAPNPEAAARNARQASLQLAKMSGAERSRALEAMARALRERQNDILESNTLDLEVQREIEMPEVLQEWIKLTPERLQECAQILERLAEMADPMHRPFNPVYRLERCHTYCQLVPLGAIAFVCEAFPDLSAIAAGMCVRTGNSIVLRGSIESSYSNYAIAEALSVAIERELLPRGSIELVPASPDYPLSDLLAQDKLLSLIVPYGRSQLVRWVAQQAAAPVLQSTMGNCYLYWSASGNLDLARSIVLDSHRSQPDPVNAIEKVLASKDCNSARLSEFLSALQAKGFEVRGDESFVAAFPELKLAEPREWSEAYLTKTVAFRITENLAEAIDWINRYSSGHADTIVTESYPESSLFSSTIRSASVYVNASPRFWRAPKQRDAVFLGMSNQRGRDRGFIGLESMTALKQIVQGIEGA